MTIQDKEKQLLVALRKNGRARVSNVAKQHGVPTSTMTDALHRLEQEGLVRHTTDIDFEKIGFPVHILGTLQTSTPQRYNLREYLQSQQQVNTLHEINDGHDYYFEALFRNTKDKRDWVEALEQNCLITDKNIHEIIGTIHKDRFLTEEKHFA